MRISDAFLRTALFASLGACSRQPADPYAKLPDSDRIVCRVAGASGFAKLCAVERGRNADGLVLTLRNPDGGFHRVAVTRDGQGVVAADGAEAATVTIVNGSQIEIALGGDHYRLPATVKGMSPAKP